MKISDEMLNKYIDGEIDSEEVKQLSVDIQNDEDALKRLRVLQAVHSTLYKINTLQAPENTNINVMKMILKKENHYVKDKAFFRFVTVIFGILTVLLVGFGIGSSDKSGSNSLIWLKNFINNTENYIPDLNVSLNPVMVTGISFSMAFILLIVLFFLFDTHRRFNKSISKY
jgi:hypothetical protein